MTQTATHRLSRCRAGLLALVLAVQLLAACDSNEQKAQAYYERGMATLAAGDLDKAAIDFRNALKLKQDDAKAMLGLAEVEEKRRNFEAAARIYQSVADRDPHQLAARVSLSRFLLASGQVETAARYAGEAQALAPDDPRVMVILAGIALNRGRNDEAVRLATAALDAAPADAGARMVLASGRIAASDPQGALAVIDAGLTRDGKNFGLLFLKLRTLATLGDQPGVERLLVQLSDAAPDDPALQNDLIGWYLEKGRTADAERAARRFAAAGGGSAAAQLRLAELIARTRGAAAAVDELRQAIAARAGDGEDEITSLTMAEAGFEAAAGQADAAMATLQSLIASLQDDDNRKRARLQLAQLHANAGQWVEATTLSETVLAADPGNPDALTLRAAARLASGQNAKAVEDLTAAAAAAPNSAAIALMLGEGYERLGSAVLAEKNYAMAVSLGGHAPASAMRFARFLMRYGRTDKAIEVLEDLRLHGTADVACLSLLAQLKLTSGDRDGATAIADALRAGTLPGAAEAADRIRAAATGASPVSVQPAASDTEAQVRSDLAAGNWAAAEAAARAGLAKQPGRAMLRLLLAEALEGRGDSVGAIAEYETLIRANPTSTVIANNLASLLSEQGDDPARLQRAYDIAIRFRNSDVPQFLDTLGWIQHLRGEQAAALPLLTRAAEKLPDLGAVQFHLGMVQKAVGQDALATATLERAIRLAKEPKAPYVTAAAAAIAQIKNAPTAN